mgnify:CR=1 FL=1
MKVPFVDLYRQYNAHQDDLDAAVDTVVQDTAFISGPYARRFESAFADFLGLSHVVGCANGTDAIELALSALGVGSGDEVIVPALTWISTAESVSAVGATPIFADIDPETYTLDLDDTAQCITDSTAAIIPVHLYGQMADMPALCRLAEQENIKIVEDAAQAHGAQLRGRPAGSWGDAATFSFYPSKNLGAWGDAGAVATDDNALARSVRHLTNHGQPQKHQHEVEGRNSRLDGIQAAVLLAKLPHLSDWNQQRRRHADRYDRLLSDLPGVSTPTRRSDGTHVFHLYVIEYARRDTLASFLSERGIATSVHYPVALPFQPCYADYGHVQSDFPHAAAATDRILSLPMFPEMTEKEEAYVANAIQDFCLHA